MHILDYIVIAAGSTASLGTAIMAGATVVVDYSGYTIARHVARLAVIGRFDCFAVVGTAD